jgi:uncharacterized membrane protein|tara:strand:- start:867 stop:1049 length:183 start_codon:yes stop_codon:yes gene_type:complete
MNDRIKKVIVWRIISTIVATVVSYWYLGEIKKSIELTAILTVVMTTLHYFYEEFWERKTT